jgi:hypothetical protein
LNDSGNTGRNYTHDCIFIIKYANKSQPKTNQTKKIGRKKETMQKRGGEGGRERKWKEEKRRGKERGEEGKGGEEKKREKGRSIG